MVIITIFIPCRNPWTPVVAPTLLSQSPSFFHFWYHPLLWGSMVDLKLMATNSEKIKITICEEIYRVRQMFERNGSIKTEQSIV